MQWPIYHVSQDIKAICLARGSQFGPCSLRILHARTNEVCFVGGNLQGGIGEGGGWLYTHARGVEVGKWPAQRTRRLADLERYRPAATVASPRTRLAAGGRRRVTKTVLCLPTQSSLEPVALGKEPMLTQSFDTIKFASICRTLTTLPKVIHSYTS